MDDQIADRAEGHYGLVIALVVLSYLIAAGAGGTLLGRLAMLFVLLLTLWLVFAVSEVPPARRLAGVLALIVIAVIAGLVLGVVSSKEVDSATNLAQGPVLVVLIALYALTPVVIVAHIMRRPTVDRETFLGGVAAYLLIGMTYTFVYVTLGWSQAGPFFGDQGDGTAAQSLFFSFTTLTTTGYGDLVPAGNPGQSVAISEAVLGQLFLVAALGKIVANLTPRTRTDEAPSSPR